jgi:GNAT superfamily N-acetyltransferase
VNTNSLATDLALEHRRELLQRADDYRRARATRPAGVGPLTLRIRPIRPEDSPLLAEIFARLSPASRYARFLRARASLTESELRYFSDVDHRDHEALIALARLTRDPVGVARFIRDASDPTSADVAVTVVDDWQNRGVGSLLATRLSERAAHEGIRYFTALMSADNRRARQLLAKTGDITTIVPDGPTTTYRVALRGPFPVAEQPRDTALAVASCG